MAINTTQEAKSRRPPGQLPNIVRHIADAETAIRKMPQSLRDALGPAFAPLFDFARQQGTLNADLWLRYDSLPGKHGSTHTDGDDSIASSADPTSISLTNVAYPGDPHHPLSREGHVHPVGADITDILDSLDGISIDPIDGAAVSDATLRRLFSAILMQLLELEKLLMATAQSEASVKSQALPVRSIAMTATDTALLASTTTERTGAAIYNGTAVVLYLKYGLGCTSTDYSFQVPSGTTYELPLSGYVGPITGILASSTGTVQVTETVTYG